MTVDTKSQNLTRILEGKISALFVNLGYDLGPVLWVCVARFW